MTVEPVEIVLHGAGKNALGTSMMEWIVDRFAEADGRPVLLTGTGDAFSAGLNLKEVAGLDHAGMDVFLRLLMRMIASVFDHPAPVVAAVNGHAIAGGCILALAADARICTTAPRARIGLNEVALGLQFPPILFRVVRYAIAPTQRQEVLLGARLHGPEEALRLGLVDRLSEQPVEDARALLASLARHPPKAYAGAKAALREGVATMAASETDQFVTEVVPSWIEPALKARLAAALAR